MLVVYLQNTKRSVESSDTDQAQGSSLSVIERWSLMLRAAVSLQHRPASLHRCCIGTTVQLASSKTHCVSISTSKASSGASAVTRCNSSNSSSSMSSTEDEDSSNGKLTMLCLHGFLQSAAVSCIRAFRQGSDKVPEHGRANALHHTQLMVPRSQKCHN